MKKIVEFYKRFISDVVVEDELLDYKRLEDIDLPDDDIETEIANLVRALISIRVDTTSSCEGHCEFGRSDFPWVSINPFRFAKNTALRHLIEKYNATYEIKWELLPDNYEAYTLNNGSIIFFPYYKGFPHYVRDPVRDSDSLSPDPYLLQGKGISLFELQRSANSLAKYIFEHRQDEDIANLVRIHGF